MKIIISLIVAVLFYRIKLVDDRKHNNFEKFKNYIKRRLQNDTNNPRNGIYEQDEWLEKDIPYQLMAQYKESRNDEGRGKAILDYYKDYQDNERTRSELTLLIILNTVYLIGNKFLFMSELAKFVSEIVLVIFSIVLCLRQPQVSLFNNPIINIQNSKKAVRLYKKTQDEIKKDISSHEQKHSIVT